MNQADVYSDLDGSSGYSSCAFSRRTKSRISPTEDKAKKKKLSDLSSRHAFSPCLSLPLFSAPLSLLFFIFLRVMSPVQSAHCTRTGDLICRACYKGDLEGEVWLRCSKPGWKRGLIESSEWDYFTFRTTPSPADLGIVLQMKRWHKFSREGREWMRMTGRGRGRGTKRTGEWEITS